jgi:hypothetical protein
LTLHEMTVVTSFASNPFLSSKMRRPKPLPKTSDFISITAIFASITNFNLHK